MYNPELTMMQRLKVYWRGGNYERDYTESLAFKILYIEQYIKNNKENGEIYPVPPLFAHHGLKEGMKTKDIEETLANLKFALVKNKIKLIGAGLGSVGLLSLGAWGMTKGIKKVKNSGFKNFFKFK